jgi:hypothetical protein
VLAGQEQRLRSGRGACGFARNRNRLLTGSARTVTPTRAFTAGGAAPSQHGNRDGTRQLPRIEAEADPHAEKAPASVRYFLRFMHPQPTTTGIERNLDDAIIAIAKANPESLLQALGMIRWLAVAQDGSSETAMQSLNDFEDIAAEAVTKAA